MNACNKGGLGLGRRLLAMFSIYKGLPTSIYVIFLATVINGVGIFVFPFLTLFLTQNLGMGEAEAGKFMLIASLAYVPGTLIGGRLADRLGRKRVMVASQLLSGLMYLPCGLLGNSALVPWFIIASLFFDGVTDPARTAMDTDLTTPGNRQAAFSLIYLGHNLGFAFGPLIAGFLFVSAPSWLFWGNALAIFAATSLVIALVPETRPSKEEIEATVGSGDAEEAHKGGLLSALAARPFLIAYTLITTFYGFVYAQHRFALPLQTGALFGDRGAAFYGSLMSLNAVLVILLATPIVRLTEKKTPIWSVAAGGALFALGFGLVAFAKSPLMFYLTTAIWTLGEIVNATNDGAYVANHTPISHRGRFQSILPIIGGTGFAVSSALVGRMISKAGLGPVWPMLGLVGALAAAGVFTLGLVEKRKQPRYAKLTDLARIETDRLLLRKHEPRDFERFWEMITDPVAKRYTGGVTKLGHDDRLALFREDCSAPFSDQGIEFAVIDRCSGEYLGYCGFRNSEELGGNELFYGYCRDSWGKGYGFEAASAVLAFLFRTIPHARYVATADDANLATVKILQRLGFRKTGRMPAEGQGQLDRYELERADFKAAANAASGKNRSS